MNHLQYTVRVGLFFLLGVALVWVAYVTLGNRSSLQSKGYNLVAKFDDLKQLKTGDDIRLAGVRIGAVETTRLAGNQAEAVLRILPSIKIARDATATVASAGLLGTNYVAITFGSPGAPALAPGSEIPTHASPDLNTIMTQLGRLGDELQTTLGALGSSLGGQDGQPGLLQRLNDLVRDNSDRISATLANLQAITDKVNRGQGTLGKLVNDPQLHDELLATVEQIKAASADTRQLLASAESVLQQVKSGQGAMGALIYDQQTADNLKATVANLRKVSDKLASGQGTLGKLINDDSLYHDAQGTLKKANRALDGMNDAAPITAVGVLANALF